MSGVASTHLIINLKLSPLPKNVTKPIPTLYVSNVPKGTPEEDVKKFFQDFIRDDGKTNATQSDSNEVQL